MIDLFLTEEQKKLRDTYRELVKTEIIPRAKEIDEKNSIPRDLLRKLTGEPFYLSSLSIPKKFGGKELSKIDVCLIAEEIGYGCPALIPFMEIAQLFFYVLKLGGNEEQQKKFLSRIAEGEIGCYALTDEGPGSDPASMKTTALKKDDYYLINGKKRLITFADLADICAVFAKTDPASGSKGITAFIVDRKESDYELEKMNDIFGLRGHRAWVIKFKDVRVPENNRVGNEGDGLKLALSVLNITRISLSWGYIGLARCAYDLALQFSKEREIMGKKLFEFQHIAFALSELATDIDAARLLAYRAAVMSEKGLPHRKETSMAKLYAGNVLIKSVNILLRILGGYGPDRAFPAERLLRDAYSWISAQGTPEVQKLIISREIFGK